MSTTKYAVQYPSSIQADNISLPVEEFKRYYEECFDLFLWTVLANPNLILFYTGYEGKVLDLYMDNIKTKTEDWLKKNGCLQSAVKVAIYW